MTANISQHVIPRLRHSQPTGRQARYRRSAISTRRSAQRGSITHTTVTAAFGISTLVVLAFLGFVYLQQVLHTASQGTDVHVLESQLIDLKQKQRELELQGAQLRSLQTVEEHVKELNLAPVNHVTYLNQSPNYVAALP